MTNSRSFWYFCATVSGLSCAVCMIYGSYIWASVNVVVTFLDLVLAASAPRP